MAPRPGDVERDRVQAGVVERVARVQDRLPQGADATVVGVGHGERRGQPALVQALQPGPEAGLRAAAAGNRAAAEEVVQHGLDSS